MRSDPALVPHHHFLLLLHTMMHAVAVMVLTSMVLPISVVVIRATEVSGLPHARIFLRQKVVEFDVEGCHRRELLQHLCQQLLKPQLSLLLGRL